MKKIYLAILTILVSFGATASDKDVLRDACGTLKPSAKKSACFDALERLSPAEREPGQALPEGSLAKEQMIRLAKAAVANNLKDPESARFRNIFTSPKLLAVCGEVNAKNSSGGYVGFRRFIFARDKLGIENDGTYFIESSWHSRCENDYLE